MGVVCEIAHVCVDIHGKLVKANSASRGLARQLEYMFIETLDELRGHAKKYASRESSLSIPSR
jgi:hypothetical protein